jgi:hypothetical protein
MIATIISKVQRRGCCGSERVYDYLVLETEDQRMEIPVSDFPLETRSIGDQVELRYVNVSGGYRYVPFRFQSQGRSATTVNQDRVCA